jgi:ABC-type lipoprotein export system ATPase subunit
VSESAIAVRGLAFSYKGLGDELFGGLDFEFTPGALTAVTGASGRGKSTMLYVLGLLLQPTRGQVLIGGEPVHALSDAARSTVRAQRIGFVFQDSALDRSRSILHSVMEPGLYAGMTRSASRARAEQLLAQVGLGERAGHRPDQISGGQAQRAAVARALMNDPAVILADEPTGNLDGDNTALVLAALQGATDNGRTVVLATHDPRVVAEADLLLEL